ncbi:MAG: 4Fe-4S binding protein [Candidatus Thermoplasmatota archaeon]|nr:4Fe-4S binding protein [Candidatus Thermoplasmatota archaeon]MBU1941762.1 4Fe-4S binding protein [Candidatus Thermoplasmatota archaeon]
MIQKSPVKPNRGFVTALERLFPLRFPLAKLSKIPGLGKLLYLMMFRTNNITCLPRDSVVEITLNQYIDAPETMVLPSQVVHRFIDQAQHHFIMDFCLCREAMTCSNYPSSLGCLFMGDAVKEIDPSYGHIASKDEAHTFIKKCSEAGLVHIIGRDKLDETWLRVTSGDKLLTVCNCCECCCLWKMLPNLTSDINNVFKKMPGVSVQVTDACIGCGVCVSACFLEGIKIMDGKAVLSEQCRGCGRCAERCPQKAITVHINDELFLEKTIQLVNQSVVVD